MRRVYRLFRCRLLIKHHQTLKLLTINALIHYLSFSPLFFPFISHSFRLFPSGSLSAPPSYRLLFPFLFLFIKHPQRRPDELFNALVIICQSPEQFAALPIHTRVFSPKKVRSDTRKRFLYFLCHFLWEEKGFFFFALLSCPSKSKISRAY